MNRIRKLSEKRLISTAYISYGHVSFTYLDESAGLHTLSSAIHDFIDGKEARRPSLGRQFL